MDTSSLEEARELYGRFSTPIRIDQTDRKTPFHWRGNRVSLGPITLTAQAYGGAFSATAETAPDLFSISFPLSSVRGEASNDGESGAIAKGRATWLASPSGRTTFHLGTRYRGLQLLVGSAEMEAALTALTGTQRTSALAFERRLSLESGVGASVDRLVRFAADEVDQGGSLVTSPLVAARFADAILFNLLLDHPHNHSEQLRTRRASAGPEYVRKTAEYLAANVARPVRLGELATLTGVSVRALQLGFLQHRGCTPMEFLRERRLELARTKLLLHGASVSDVARECGFAHLGRFSAQYRARFGELPSDTRRRTR